MLLTDKVIVKWNSKNKEQYVDKGYNFTRMGDEFEINVSDLMRGSQVLVRISCDYCGKEYTKPYNRYILENELSTVHKDACGDCKNLKAWDSCEIRYNCRNPLELDEVKERVAQTNIERYGAPNPFSNPEVIKKIRNTNIKKYGCEYVTQNPSVIEKGRQTSLQKYGVTSWMKLHIMVKDKNPRWKGGVVYHRHERACFEYINWRNSVFQRDRYICQACGQHTSTLNAHHIYNWKDYPDLRFDVTNGITLCKDCHIKFHSLYGKHNNTQSQIDEFISNGKKVC